MSRCSDFEEETSDSEAGERRPRETRPDRVTASAGDRQTGVKRLQPDLGDLDEPLPLVATSFALAESGYASSTCGDDLRLICSVESQTFMIARPKAA